MRSLRFRYLGNDCRLMLREFKRCFLGPAPKSARTSANLEVS